MAVEIYDNATRIAAQEAAICDAPAASAPVEGPPLAEGDVAPHHLAVASGQKVQPVHGTEIPGSILLIRCSASRTSSLRFC